MYHDPVHEKPQKNMDEKKWEWVPPEEVESGPGGQRPGEHALGDRLEQQEMWAHGGAQFGPSEKREKR